VYGTHVADYYTLPSSINFIETATWARTTTTATVTFTNHGLLTTNGRIVVTASSSEPAITFGLKTVNVTGPNTFTFTCLNAGGTTGTLSFQRVNGGI
jgi:hypothetical protein